MCFHKQIFWRFSLGLIFGYSKTLIICCGFIVKISEDLFMYVVNRSKKRNYYWILWSRIEAKNPVFVTASRTLFFSVSFFLSSNQTSLNGFKIRVAESNFIQFWFALSNRVAFARFVEIYLFIEIFVTDQPTFISENWKFPFFLSFWSSFF